MRSLLAACCVVLAFVFIGCFETTVPLDDKPDRAKVDRSLIGDWTFRAAGDEKPAKVVLRNLDDKRYYVEWSDEGEKVTRGVGFISNIKDVPFAQVRPLTDDGSVSEKHWIMRVSIDGGKLGIRQLNGDFFKDHPAGNTDQLRRLLEANLDNPAMYDGEFRYGTKEDKPL